MESTAVPSHPLPLLPGSPRPILVGMIHLLPLPGSPGWGGSMAAVLDRALDEGLLLREGGFDALLLENYGDLPFHPDRVPPETVAAMAVVGAALLREVGLPLGVNVLRNDARAALAVASACGADFIRVNVHVGATWTDQGLLQGAAHRTLRTRAALGSPVAVVADVLVKHGTAAGGSGAGEAARDLWHRGRADGLIVTGPATGAPADLAELRQVRDAVPEAPLWVGSGLTPESAAAALAMADGAIVGSTLHGDGVAGHGIQRERVARFMEAVGRGGPTR